MNKATTANLEDFTDMIKLPDGDLIKPELISQVYFANAKTYIKFKDPVGFGVLTFDGDQRHVINMEVAQELRRARERWMNFFRNLP